MESVVDKPLLFHGGNKMTRQLVVLVGIWWDRKTPDRGFGILFAVVELF